jgi:hypothetical protein
VLVNLLDNAARYTEEGGDIRLSAAREDHAVVITVKDNGNGIAPEMLPGIFDLFTRARRSAGEPHGGLGIGLSLVRNVVELHGGSVEAKSDGATHGAEFTVRLPLPDQQAQAEHPVKTQPGRETPRRIVVIDDNVDAAQSLAMLLRLKGHEVHVAYDGPAGVDLTKKTLPDCVLVDIGLPGIDGYEARQSLPAVRHSRKRGIYAAHSDGSGSPRRLRFRAAGRRRHRLRARLVAGRRLRRRGQKLGVSESIASRGSLWPSIGIFGGSGGVGFGTGVTMGPGYGELQRCERTLFFQDGRVVDQAWQGPGDYCASFRR